MGEKGYTGGFDPLRQRLGGRVLNRGTVVRLTAVVVAIAAWELFAASQPSYLFPGLAAVYEATLTQIEEYGLISAYLRTMATVFVGYSIAVVVGGAVGVGMGLDKRIEVMLDPYVSALYVAPVSALVPIIILVSGPTFESRVFVVFMFVVFEMIVTTFNGTKTLPSGLLNVGQSFGAGRLTTVRKIVVPFTLPYMFAGMRLGIGRAIKGVILAELLVEFSNLGAIIREWETLFQIAGILSVTILLMLTGIALTRGMTLIRDRLITWKTGGTQ